MKLDGIFPRPLPRRGLVPGAVGLVDVGNFWDKGVIGVGVCEHGADGQEDYRHTFISSCVWQLPMHAEECVTFGNGQGRAPLITQNVQADAPIRVDVGVIDTGGEVDLGRLEGVVGGKVYRKEEDSTRVWTFTL